MNSYVQRSPAFIFFKFDVHTTLFQYKKEFIEIAAFCVLKVTVKFILFSSVYNFHNSFNDLFMLLYSNSKSPRRLQVFY